MTCLTMVENCGVLDNLKDALLFLAVECARFDLLGLVIQIKIAKRLSRISDEGVRSKIKAVLEGRVVSVVAPFVQDPHLFDDLQPLEPKTLDRAKLKQQLVQELKRK